MDERLTKQGSISSGIRWSGSGQVVKAILRMGVSIVLARLLAPEDFGLLAMASVITGFITIFQFLGTSGVIIQKEKLTPGLIDSLFLLNVVIGLILTIGVALGSPFLAQIYDSAEVTPIIRVMSLSLFISSFGGIPGALLGREMRFDTITKIGVLCTAVHAIVAIGLAFLGWGVWALVVANLIWAVIETAAMFRASGYHPHFVFVWSEVREVMSFCLNLTSSTVVGYLAKDSDKLIIGRWLGVSTLGYYTMAYRFSLFPIEFIAPVLARVLYPAYSRMQDDPAQMGRTFQRACNGISFIIFPMMTGIAVVSNSFVHAVLGEKWILVIPIISILAPVGVMNSLFAPTRTVLLGAGRSDWYLRLTIVAGIGTIGAFLAGVPWGLTGVVTCYAIIRVPLTWLAIHYALRLVQMSPGQLLAGLVPYAAVSAAMGMSAYATQFFMEQFGQPKGLVLAVSVTVGIVVYIALMLFVRPPALYDFIQLIPSQIRQKLTVFLRLKT